MASDQLIKPTAVTVDWVVKSLDGQDARWDKLRATSVVEKLEISPVVGVGFLSYVLKLKIVFANEKYVSVILKAPRLRRSERYN